MEVTLDPRIDVEVAVRARELLAASGDTLWNAGSAEPWLANLLGALITASGAQHAIEIGAFQGYTSRHLAHALDRQPWPTTLTICEIDAARALDTQNALDKLGLQRVVTKVVLEDSLRWIPTLPDASVDFCWLDGNHEKQHVAQEIALLLPKLAPGGLLCGHDTYGVCDLQEVFRRYNGTSYDFPRLGPAGGIGIIQSPTDEQQLAAFR